MKTQLLIALMLFTTGILFAAANLTQKFCTVVKGEKGETGQASSNWKQCVWRSGDDRDNGLIKECLFKKTHYKTSLRVFYSGALRIYRCSECCKRWFFTFNGAECSGPMAIDGVIYMGHWHDTYGKQTLRIRHIEGYCENIPKGQVRVGFNVGNCAGYGNADAYSGWNSVSRIVVEEVPAPQQ